MFVLLQSMIKEGNNKNEDMMAICRYQRHGSEPRLVALLPQQEVSDDYGDQVAAPGMHMVFLPFSDDIREPETNKKIIGDHVEVRRFTSVGCTVQVATQG